MPLNFLVYAKGKESTLNGTNCVESLPGVNIFLEIAFQGSYQYTWQIIHLLQNKLSQVEKTKRCLAKNVLCSKFRQKPQWIYSVKWRMVLRKRLNCFPAQLLHRSDQISLIKTRTILFCQDRQCYDKGNCVNCFDISRMWYMNMYWNYCRLSIALQLNSMPKLCAWEKTLIYICHSYLTCFM